MHWVLGLLLVAAQFSQSNTGELRVTVTDAAGLPLPGALELVSQANQLQQRFDTDPGGTVVAKRLPFGTYRVTVTRDGFAPFSGLVEIRSALPTAYQVTLNLATLQTQVTVSAERTLLDLRQAAAAQRIGAEALGQRTTALPGRALPDLVNTQPGWLLEANGILHPRGSEYQTQYVVDGLPMTDNRSPAFAPEFGTDDVHTMNILTGGYPAEYGRKLGGVIEVVTSGQGRRGFGGAVSGSAGSFDTKAGDALAEYGWPEATLTVSASASATDRYLDPPVAENYSNHGATSNASLHFEKDVTASHRFGVILRHGDARFLVPNERVQHEAGQRQDRDSAETLGQFSYQHIVSANLLGDVRGMIRNVSAGLWSNAASTPVLAQQDRGFRELYLKATVSAHAGAHELKAGADVDAGTVRERFDYRLTDASRFDAGTPLAFAFDGRARNREQALFIQDQIRLRAWTVNAGLRWDRYRFLVHDRAFSPRLAVAWSWPAADLVLRATYDRVFQTPAFENLLLASAPDVDTLGDDVVRLPVPASRGNFYEAGLSKALFGALRLDASYFKRQMRDVADDDLLLNTGVSFPIAFDRAEITGAELKLDLPHWKRFSGFLSYSHLRGFGELPITGGLFLGEEGGVLLASRDRFPVTQDQRHSIRGRVSYRFRPGGWLAASVSYGSGLPFEDFDEDPEQARDEFGPRVVDRVNFDTGRVRPNFSLDASAGAVIVKTAKRSLQLQAEVRNLTNRLDVINFAGLFSGTALAPPRSVAIRVRVDF
jgi:outer membrane cobalamin receptor